MTRTSDSTIIVIANLIILKSARHGVFKKKTVRSWYRWPSALE